MKNNAPRKKRHVLNSLFWRISILLLFVLTVVGLSYVYITVRYSDVYFQHINQRLNRSVAANIVATSKPFLNKKVNPAALEDIFHSVMAVNPGLEVYLLDDHGKILSYFAPQKKILLRSVNLKPISRFIRSKGNAYITGEDPRHPGTKKIFSVEPIYSDGSISGYMYVVLASEEYDNVSNFLKDNYLIQVGYRSMILTLLAALVIGLIIIRILTGNFTRVLEVMQKFRQGDLTARVRPASTGDIRELAEIFNEMADILTENMEKLKAVEVLRRELIANVSHDLRTPISIIHGYIETLQMKEENLSADDRKRYMNTVLESTENLKKLVNELFELSKLEARQVQPKNEVFHLSELLSDISNKYVLVAEKRGVLIDTALSKDIPPVYADISLIERVVQNLLDNAIKFTPEGGKVLIRTGRKDNRVEVTVSDSGGGIAEHDRDKIFGRYYTADTPSDMKTNTGLGLAIAKKILELHDSSLYLKSDAQSGSTFGFDLGIHGL